MQVVKKSKRYILFFIVSLFITIGFNVWLDPPGSFPKKDALDYIGVVIILIELTLVSFVLMIGKILFEVIKNRMGKKNQTH